MKKVIFCGGLFTATDESVQKDMAIVIEGNKILEIVPAAQAKAIEGEVIDLSDKFVMPGMIDAHCHINMDGNAGITAVCTEQSQGDITIDTVINAKKNLMAGFTSVRDEGDFQFTAIAVRDAVNAGKIAGPRIMTSGMAITGTGGHADSHFSPDVTGKTTLGVVINSADEARAAARYNFKYGADQLKIMATGGVMSLGDDPKCSELTFEEMRAAIEIAESRGRITSAHAHGSDGIKIAVRAGITSIEHGMLMDDECVELMAQYGTYLIPTIIAAKNIAEAPQGVLPGWMVEKAQLVLAGHKENLRKCREANIKIGFGSDAGTSFNYHGQQTVELALMVDFGFTPAQTLIAATRVNSQLMRWDDRVGTLEAGKLADVVAFDASPLEDITTAQKASFVMKDGCVYKKDGVACA